MQEQQDQGQMESVLVKLQLELQQQLQPAAQSDTAGEIWHTGAGDEVVFGCDAQSVVQGVVHM